MMCLRFLINCVYVCTLDALSLGGESLLQCVLEVETVKEPSIL